MNALLNKYHGLRKEIKAGVWFTICNFIYKGIALIVVPIYTRLLSTEDYGAYTVFQSWFNILLIITTLEISRGYFKVGLVKYEGNEDQYTLGLIGLSNAVTLGFVGIYFIAPSFWNALLGMKQSLVYVMMGYLLLYPIWEFWAIRQRFEHKYKTLVLVTIIIAVTTPVIGIIGIKVTDFPVEAVVLGKIAIQTFFCVVLYIYYFQRGKKVYNGSLWKTALRFNLPLMPYLLSTVVLNQADRLQIQSICGATDTAIYSVAYSVAMILQLFNTAIGDSFIPWLYKSLKKEQYSSIDSTTNVLSILVAVLNLMLVLFAPEVIAIFAPAKYAEAIWVIPPVTASVYFMFLFQRYINVEVYYGENMRVSAYSILIAVLNLLLNQALIPLFGYIAAAYTTLFCYVLFSFIHYYSVQRICKKNCNGDPVFSIRASLLIGIVFLMLVAAFMLMYGLIWVRYVFALLIIVLVVIKRKKVMRYVKLMKK